MRRLLIVIVFTLSLAGAGSWLYRTQIAVFPAADKALVLMEAGDFETAADVMSGYITWLRGAAKDHYVYAVALVRKTPPEMKKAVRHRRKAERMGYQVPEWFDNYVLLQEARSKKQEAADVAQ